VGAGQLAEEVRDSDSPRALKVRAFFGLPLPDEQRDELGRYLEECTRRAPQFRWTPAANLHLTIRFLGHLEVAVAEEIADRLTGTHLPGFELALGEAGAFKRGRLARVVWLGLRSGEKESGALAAAVEAECQRAGLEREARAYHPHLTLARARLRDGTALPELPDAPPTAGWRAAELILYRSRLGRAGAVYEPLRSIKLR
jgi:RNA 2',3'-cyclic 3'-phosphodiesterase